MSTTTQLHDNAPLLHGMALPELKRVFTRAGVSERQALLAFQAFHRHGILDPEQMPEISESCKAYLKSLPPPPSLAVDAVHTAQDGTIKLRLKTAHGDFIESVIIPSGRRVTLCVSSQVGCAAGCTFCHTGTMGLLRNLASWEIVEQHRLARTFTSRPISNIVFMGMGEPLHNEESVAQACAIFSHDRGAGLPRRRVVVSTAGVGNRIRPFWERSVASLAVSLHATTDELRNQIVPLNRQWNLAALRQTLLDIPWRRGDTLMVAYLLLHGVNDTQDDARRLAEWSRGLPVKVNLLEFNPYPGSQFTRASAEKMAQFRNWIHELGLFHTLRHSRGDDVLAACGQLAVGGGLKRTSRK